MKICTVVGSAVSTIKDPRLEGKRIMLVQEARLVDETRASGKGSRPDVFAAVDVTTGAGEGQMVLVVEGYAAACMFPSYCPVDAAIVAVLDSYHVKNDASASRSRGEPGQPAQRSGGGAGV